jgi:hypothetical protein
MPRCGAFNMTKRDAVVAVELEPHAERAHPIIQPGPAVEPAAGQQAHSFVKFRQQQWHTVTLPGANAAAARSNHRQSEEVQASQIQSQWVDQPLPPHAYHWHIYLGRWCVAFVWW